MRGAETRIKVAAYVPYLESDGGQVVLHFPSPVRVGQTQAHGARGRPGQRRDERGGGEDLGDLEGDEGLLPGCQPAVACMNDGANARCKWWQRVTGWITSRCR